MYPLTNVPFPTQLHRDTHFLKHGASFGAQNAEEYEQMADDFMFGAKSKNTKECTRPNHGNRLRFDFWTRRFGAANIVAPEFVRTFYIVKQPHIDYHGGGATYFGWECGRINV
jgi:hypothetical protein